LNLNIRGLGQSPTIAINDETKNLQSQGRQVYRLGLGQSPFPVPAQVVDSLKLSAHEKDYLPAKGLPLLRQAIAEYHRRHEGIEYSEANILIGPGSKELMFLLQLVYYGELIVPTPCWVSYIPQARIIGRQVSLIQTSVGDRWQITAEKLEEHCRNQEDTYRPRILVLNYPGNPDGCTYTAEQLKDMAEVARKYQVVLLSDEIYGEIHHTGKHISVARFYPEGTIISTGLSKWCGAGGWRLGAFAFPPELAWLLEKMASVASETFTSVSAPIQFAAVTAFKGGLFMENYLWHTRRILAAVGKKCADSFDYSNILVPFPEGGFYLFPDFTYHKRNLSKRGIKDSATFCRRLLDETGVALLPGSSFGRPKEEITARIAYVDFDGIKALTASEQIPLDQPLPEDFVDNWCSRVVEAMNLITDWTQK
jgi:aspartate aminotransferase